MRYKMSNELYMLQTISLLQQVEDLNLNVQYFKKTRLKQQELYRNCPIAFQWENPVPVAWEGMKPLEITLKVKPGSDHFEINNMLVGGEQVYVKNKAVQFGEVISTPAGLFSITNLYSPTEDTGSTLFTIKVSSPRSFANKIKRNLTARQISDGRTNATTMANMSDIIVLTLQDEIKERAVRILHSLIQNYIQDNKEFSAQSIEKSIVFINDRLSQIERDLGIIETDYSSYRSVRRIVREDSQSQIAITSDARYRDELTELEIQMKLLGMIKEFLAGQNDTHEMIPTNLGIKDVGLTSGIERYNTLIVERNRLLAGSSLTNPRVVNANLQLDNMKDGIHVSIKNVENTHTLRLDALREQISKGEKEISTIPSQQLELARITRRQEIIEPLYRLLQQKKEEYDCFVCPAHNPNYRRACIKIFSHQTQQTKHLPGLFAAGTNPPSREFLHTEPSDEVIGKQDVAKNNIPIFAVIPNQPNKLSH